MGAPKRQTGIFRGIYEFDDPSASLLAARVPASGSVDLYDGTTVIVRPNQCALFIYKGRVADLLTRGTHTLNTDNVPVLTRLANWRKGFQSPVRAELWFFSGNVFTARRWGTAQPVLANLNVGTVPIRGYGNFHLFVKDPRKLFQKLVGTRYTLDVSDVEEYVQGMILHHLPQALEVVREVENLPTRYTDISARLLELIGGPLAESGLGIHGLQILSLVPPKEVLDALDTKLAMRIIGDPKEYLLYQAAHRLEALGGQASQDPMQMMMGLMLGKGLVGADFHDRERKTPGPEGVAPVATLRCQSCNHVTSTDHRFCPHCGKAFKP